MLSIVIKLDDCRHVIYFFTQYQIILISNTVWLS